MTAQPLDTCDCCEGVNVLTPASLENTPGLSALVYRIGTHGRFKATMHAKLSGQLALRDLTTRDDADPAIALLDAWATVLDVLTFYQERIANEGFLRTATERRSVLELARAIGYELNPGVAASTYLAFTLEEAPGSPGVATIDIGAKAQSLPDPGEQPQTFETTEKIVAQAAWNALKPRLTQPQTLLIQGSTLYLINTSTPAKQLYLAGAQTNLKAGDLILVTTGPTGSIVTLPLRIRRVVVEADFDRTRIDLDRIDQPLIPTFTPATYPAGTIPAQTIPFSSANVQAYIVQKNWSERDLNAFLTKNNWNAQDALDAISDLSAAPANQAIYALRERVGFFGNNAPYFNSIVKADGTTLYPAAQNWDGTNGWEIWKDWPNNTYFTDASVYLERSLPGLLAGTWAVFERPTAQCSTYWISAINERSLAGFGLSGKATGLTLQTPNQGSITKSSAFKVRQTIAHVQSESLDLIDLPIDAPIPAASTGLMLDRMVLGLQVGQSVILSGEQVNAEGVTRSEVLALKDILHAGGYTTLVFQTGLQYGYVRKSVTINANVAAATHGETKTEVLGSGDASQSFQSFVLKQSPLTYVSAPTISGAASTLEARVNDVEWEEAESLYGLGPRDRNFITQIADDGKVTVQFGDSASGARPPSGSENITSTYRVGTGLAGMVKAGQLSLLMTRPLGVKGVTNPLAPTGAADPEKLSDARQNAPFTVMTLGRIVSLQDFEDFTRAFAGIGKAQATWLWDGERRLVHITVAAANGTSVDETSPLYKNLLAAIDAARDPIQRVVVKSYQPLTFNVEAKVLVAPGYLLEKVLPAVTAALQQAFAFAQRSFGQAMTKSEVLSVIQSVEGVEAVDLEKLYLTGQTASLNDRLPVQTARWDVSTSPPTIKPAELLTLNPSGIQLTEMPR